MRKPRYKQLGPFLILTVPNLILIAAFTFYPLMRAIQVSQFNWDFISTPVYVGWANYLEWFTAPQTGQVLFTTIMFSLATVLGSMTLGLLTALLLRRKILGRGLARTLVFSPYVMAGAVVGVVWLFVFDPKLGLLNPLLTQLNLPAPDWYLDGPWALLMLCIVNIWRSFGFAAVIYLAAMTALSKDLEEAAFVDGASKFQVLRHIVLPQLRPATTLLSILLTVMSLQSFDLVQVMTQGGPSGATTTIMFQVYDQAFNNNRFGYANAIATVLFLMVLVVGLAQLKISDRIRLKS